MRFLSFPASSLPLFFSLTVTFSMAISQADDVTVGDPNHPANLPSLIIDAHHQGARDITIAPGIYHIPAKHHDDTLALEHWIDTTIHANGVTLIFDELEHNAKMSPGAAARSCSFAPRSRKDALSPSALTKREAIAIGKSTPVIRWISIWPRCRSTSWINVRAC
jgi:hypothetical protein